MTYFKDIGKGSNNFFAGKSDVPGNVDFRLGETWSLSVNQGSQTIEGKRNGAGGFLKYSHKSILPEKPFKKVGGNLEVKINNANDSKGSYEVELKKLNLGGASVDLKWDGSQQGTNALTAKAKYGALKNVNLYGEFKVKGGKAKVNATYTKGDFVGGVQIAGTGAKDAKFDLAGQWNRSNFDTKLSAELTGGSADQLVPADLALKLEKKVSNDFTAYIQGTFTNWFTGNVQRESGGVNTLFLGGDFNLNDSSSLQLSVCSNNNGEADEGNGNIRAVYTHKLGDNLTGSISFDNLLDKPDVAQTVFADPRIGWKLAFA